MFPGIGTYKGEAVRVRVFQSVGDIMQGIMSTHRRYTAEYDKIAPTFDGYNTLKICQKIYNFLLSKTHYKVEPDSKQTLRSPAAILALGSDPAQGLDCKSYSLFIGGVLDALNRRGHNIKWCYRFASYRFGDKLPHHVFVVVNPGTKNEIFVDPVIKPFNYKKPYFYKVDKTPSNMALYSISGTRANRQARKAEKKQKTKANIKKAGKVALKFAPITAVPRNSFLLLVKLNIFKLRDKLRALNAQDPAKLRKFWESVGGNMAALVKAMSHKGRGQVGLEPATTTAAAVATATPLIIKILKLLKEAGIETKDLANFATSVVKKAIDKKAEAETGEDPVAFEPETILDDASGEDSSGNDSGSEDFTFEGSSEESIGGIPKNTVLMVGAGALALYLFTRKK